MKQKDSIFQKKIMLPKISGAFINRKKLEDAFEEEEKNIFILSGKAGNGKTNAAAQCFQGKREETLWYTFDKSDNEEESFLKHFTCAMIKIDEQVEEQLRDFMCSPRRLKKDSTKCLINILLEMAENKKKGNKKLSIVLDGFQYVVNQNVLNFVKLLLEYLSEDIKIFILTSANMQKCFSKYVAEGNYRKITEKELRFSLEEIKELAEKHFGKKQVKKEYIQQVEHLTNGWPVAVGCLFQYMNEMEEEFSKVMEMSRKNLLMETVLHDYICYEIYEKFSKEEQQFLLKTAVLREMDEDLCNSCLMREDSDRMLYTFLNHYVMEAFWEDKKKYFRYFELFRLFLLEEGEKSEQREVKERAVAFYISRHEYEQAIQYTEKDEKWTSSLFEQCGKKMLRENRLDLVKQCIDTLLEKEHEFSVFELEIAAEYFYRIGDHKQMETYLNYADSMFGSENKYGMYRSLYRALFHFEEEPEKYERQINNVLFFLEENHIAFPYLLEREQVVLDRIKQEKTLDLQVSKEKKIKVTAFGTFQAVVLEDGRELSWRTKKGSELFAYLLDRDGEAVERKILLAELWKTELPNNAVAMLHNMFYNMRKELSYYNLEHIVQYKNKKYSIDVSLIQSDLEEMKLIANYVETKNVEKLQEHKRTFLTYKGRYLEDMDNEWIRGKQEYYEKIFEKGCCILAEECMERAEYEGALLYLKNALSVSVYSEKIMGMMMQCYQGLHDLKGAKKQYEEFCILLKNELDLTPGEELQKSYQECMTR